MNNKEKIKKVLAQHNVPVEVFCENDRHQAFVNAIGPGLVKAINIEESHEGYATVICFVSYFEDEAREIGQHVVELELTFPCGCSDVICEGVINLILAWSC